MPLLDLFWTMLLIYLWVMVFFMIVKVLADVFRRDMSGWAKAGWTIVIVLIPLLGALIYLIAHGKDMTERDVRDYADMQAQQDEYIRSVAASSTSVADEVAKLAALRDKGVISNEQFEAQKAELLS